MEYRYRIDYRPRPAFLVDAYFRRGAFRVAVLGTLAAAIGLGGYLGLQSILLLVLGAVAVSLAGLFLGMWVWRRRLAIRRVRRDPDRWLCDYAVCDDGLHYNTPLGEGLLRWGFGGELKRVGSWWAIVSSEVGLLPLSGEAPQEVLDFVRKKLTNPPSVPEKEP